MYNPEIMSRNLRQLRAAAGLSYAELSRRTGICFAAVWRLENKSDSSPRLFTVDILADFYGVSLDWLCGRTEKTPAPAATGNGGAWVKNNHDYHTTTERKCQMKKSEVKKMQALSIRRDDAVSDENWFLMMQDIFKEYETALLLERHAREEAEEACCRG